MSKETIVISKRKNQIHWGIRILLSFLFLISAVAKLYPSPYFALTTFEIKQLLPMGFSEVSAAYFSRTLIGCEFALGFALLQPHFLKRLVIPVSFLMLLIFVVELTYEIISSGNSGNCGCFGTLIPMTPLEAIIKNIVAMGLLGYLYKAIPHNPLKKNILVLVGITVVSIASVFILGSQGSDKTKGKAAKIIEVVEEPVVMNTDTSSKTGVTVDAKTATTDPTKLVNGKDPKATTIEPIVEKVDEPAQKKSGYKSLYPDIDKGKKILCFFAPGCEHCKETAKALTEMRSQVANFPEIRIAFMDEEAELIPAFFEFAGAKYTHSILDIATFWKTVGNRDTPGVFYIWNGNIVKVYDGIDANAFKAKEFKALVQKPWSEVK